MLHRGKVLEKTGTEADIQLEPKEDEQGCGTCGCCSGGPEKSTIVKAATGDVDSISVGDQVELDVQMPNQAVVSLLVFGLPLLLTLSGGIAGHAPI